MTRELQLRDKEILEAFDALVTTCANTAALVLEVMKQCDCTESRIDDAIRRVKQNPNHLYWQ